jgi:hypothetical protein
MLKSNLSNPFDPFFPMTSMVFHGFPTAFPWPGMVQWMCQPIPGALEVRRIRRQNFALQAIELGADAAAAAATGGLLGRGFRRPRRRL